MTLDADRARAIFDAAVENHSPDQWDDFLEKSCGQDTELKQHIQMLLEAHMGDDPFLDRGDDDSHPLLIDTATTEPRSADQPAARIGPYKLLQKIGEGGMGIVYMAEQVEPIERRVALKIVKPGLDSRQVIARFEAERQALAMMDHPHIATVLDAGTTSPDDSGEFGAEGNTGRPYFVMELVKGVPLTTYCDQRHLTVRQRLELFVPMCQAVQHAHQKGIIHRDLKPTNILVASYDGEPSPKVIDFGVAKAINAKLTDKTLFTEFGQVIGSLRYMSPEQAELNQLDIDTRSDIYSLGVVLYELLTGTTPLEIDRVRDGPLIDTLRLIHEQHPPTPSRRLNTTKEMQTIGVKRGVEPTKLRRLVRGELDAIVMKCLEKDRNQRYQTAHELADDINSWLDGRPVKARSLGVIDRTWRSCKRKPVTAALLAATAVMLVTVSVVSATAALMIASSRDAASMQRDRAMRVIEAMTADEALDHFQRQDSLTEDQKVFLNTLVTYYREGAEQAAFTVQERIRQARAYGQMGRMLHILGQSEDALTAFTRSHDLWAQLQGSYPDSIEYRRERAWTNAQIGETLSDHGKWQESIDRLVDARSILGQLRNETSEAIQIQIDLALCHIQLGHTFDQLGEFDAALVEYKESEKIYQQLRRGDFDSPEFKYGVAASAAYLGSVLVDQRKWDEALVELERAVGPARQLATEFPENVSYCALMVDIGDEMGKAWRRLEKWDESEIAFQLAIEYAEQLARTYPASRHHRRSLSSTYNNLAIPLFKQGRYAEAEALWIKSAENYEDLGTMYPGFSDYGVDAAGSYCNIGNLRQKTGDYRESLEWYQRAISILRPIHNEQPRHNRTRLFLRNVIWGRAQTFDKMGEYADALVEWDETVRLDPENLDNIHAERAVTLAHLSRHAEAMAEAEQILTQEPGGDQIFVMLARAFALSVDSNPANGDGQADPGDRAIELIREAIDRGYSNVEELDEQTDFEVLRDRAEFQELLRELREDDRLG